MKEDILPSMKEKFIVDQERAKEHSVKTHAPFPKCAYLSILTMHNTHILNFIYIFFKLDLIKIMKCI